MKTSFPNDNLEDNQSSQISSSLPSESKIIETEAKPEKPKNKLMASICFTRIINFLQGLFVSDILSNKFNSLRIQFMRLFTSDNDRKRGNETSNNEYLRFLEELVKFCGVQQSSGQSDEQTKHLLAIQNGIFNFVISMIR